MTERFWFKMHHAPNGVIIAAICDEELLGKDILINNKIIKKVSESFYGGVLITEDEVFKRIESATIINMLGDRIVKKAIQYGLISSKNVFKIGSIPHIQIFNIS
ncbi:MAG: DUF424 family protein [Nitrososphaerota archaeon]